MAVLNSQKSSTMALSNMAPPVALPLIFWLSLPKVPLLSLPAACPDPHPCGCQDPFQRPHGAQQGEHVSDQQNSSERWVYPDSPCPAQWQYLLYCQHLFGICGNSLLPLLPLCPSVPRWLWSQKQPARVARWLHSPLAKQPLPRGCLLGLGESHLLLGLLLLLLPLSVMAVAEGPLHAEREGFMARSKLGRGSPQFCLPLLFLPCRCFHAGLPPKVPLNTDSCCFFPPQRALSEASKSEHPSHVLNSTASNPDG